MQISFNQNMYTSPAFRSVNRNDVVTKILKENMNPKQAHEFVAIEENQEDNPVNINLYASGNSKKLNASIYPPTNSNVKGKQVTQGMFQSYVGFLNSCAKKADAIRKAYEEELEINNILDKN